MSPVVIVGATGFLGTHVVETLAAFDSPVIAVGRAQRWTDVPKGVRYQSVDLSVPSMLIPNDIDPREGFDLVYLAWEMDRRAPFARHTEHLGYLAAMLDYWAERGLSRLVAIVSAEEYGQLSGCLGEDDDPEPPLTPYGWGKRSAYSLVSAWSHMTGIPTIWLRPFIVYGPGQRSDMLIPYALKCARGGEKASFSDGSQERDFIYVGDVAAAVERSLRIRLEGCQTFNLGRGESVRVRSVIEEIARVLSAEALFHIGALDRRVGEPDRVVANVERARSILGWEAEFDWRRGLRKTIA